VTGALGFIGSAYVRAHKDDDIFLLARPSGQRFLCRLEVVGGRPGSAQFCWLDLARDDLADAVGEVDTIVHFAAKTFVDRSIADPTPFIESNVVGSFKLLEAIRRSRTVEHVWWQSTDEVYGAILEGAYREDARLNPSNPYAATKAAADGLALSYFNTYGIKVIIGRAENAYGPWQGREKAIPTFVRCALQAKPIPVYGDGQHRRQWVHVVDVVECVDHLLEHGKPGEVYHVAGHQELSNLELAQGVLGALGLPAERIQFIEDRDIRPGHDRRYALSTQKVRETGWQPRIKLQDGLPNVVEWYAAHKEWTFG